MMRIGISGIGGAGKTTLALALSTRLRIPHISEGVREWLAANGTARPWSLAIDDQLRLQRDVLAWKIGRERALTAFVSDRTTADAVSLLTLRLMRAGLDLPPGLRDDALAHARETYDLAVVMTNRLSPEPDDVALLDPLLRPRELALTMDFYAAAGTPVIRIDNLPGPEIVPFVLGTLRRHSIRLPSLLRTLCRAASAELDPHTSTLYIWGSALTDNFRPETSDVDALLVLSAPVDRDAIERFKKRVAIQRFDLSVIAAENGLQHERLPPEILAAEIAGARFAWGREDLLQGLLPPVGSLKEQLHHRLGSLRRRLAIHDLDPEKEPVRYILKEIGYVGKLQQQLAESGKDALAREAVLVAARTRDNGWRDAGTAAVIALAHTLLAELEDHPA